MKYKVGDIVLMVYDDENTGTWWLNLVLNTVDKDYMTLILNSSRRSDIGQKTKFWYQGDYWTYTKII